MNPNSTMIQGRSLAHVAWSRNKRARAAANLVTEAAYLASPTVIQAAQVCRVPTYLVAQVLHAQGHYQYHRGNGNGSHEPLPAIDPADPATEIDAVIKTYGVALVWERIEQAIA